MILTAASENCPKVIYYIMHQADVLIDAELLTKALNYAGVRSQLQAALALVIHGAQWPAVLGHHEFTYKEYWFNETLAFARLLGGTSPVLEWTRVCLQCITILVRLASLYIYIYCILLHVAVCMQTIIALTSGLKLAIAQW
jgi:hypothetical protein